MYFQKIITAVFQLQCILLKLAQGSQTAPVLLSLNVVQVDRTSFCGQTMGNSFSTKAVDSGTAQAVQTDVFGKVIHDALSQSTLSTHNEQTRTSDTSVKQLTSPSTAVLPAESPRNIVQGADSPCRDHVTLLNSSCLASHWQNTLSTQVLNSQVAAQSSECN